MGNFYEGYKKYIYNFFPSFGRGVTVWPLCAFCVEPCITFDVAADLIFTILLQAADRKVATYPIKRERIHVFLKAFYLKPYILCYLPWKTLNLKSYVHSKKKKTKTKTFLCINNFKGILNYLKKK